MHIWSSRVFFPSEPLYDQLARVFNFPNFYACVQSNVTNRNPTFFKVMVDACGKFEIVCEVIGIEHLRCSLN